MLEKIRKVFKFLQIKTLIKENIDYSTMAKSKKHKDSKSWAFLGVFLTLVGFLLVLLLRKDDEYAMYYGKLGLVLFLGWVILAVIAVVPIIGWIINVLGSIVLLILWIVAWIAALSGEKKRLPVLSDLADKINL